MLRIELAGLIFVTMLGLVPDPYAHAWGWLPEGTRGTALLLVFFLLLVRKL